MWKQLVQQIDPSAVFAAAAKESDIAQAEQLLKVVFPDVLRALLLETDGIMGQYGPYYIWPIAMTTNRNLSMRQETYYRESYESFQDLLFFGEAGIDGLLFALPIERHQIVSPAPIYQWEPIDDSRVIIAPTLENYLLHWVMRF